MIKIVGYRLSQNSEGKQFVSLEIQGGVEFVQSQQTGRFYATAKKALMASTFDEQIAKELVGSEMPGKVERVACEPYQYQIPNSNETVLLNYRYEYQPEEAVVKPIHTSPDPEEEEEYEEEHEEELVL